ncbi:MAG: homoserine kinase [Methylococcales bacterium]|nr:homoserine kinase [Methylococcales bacterium]
MANYTQLTAHDIQAIANNYDLTVLNFESINGGAGNSSYLLQTRKEKYVLTVCDDKALKDAINLGKLLLWLEKNNFSTTRLVLSVTNAPVIRYQDKPVMLKIYIEGDTLEQLDSGMLAQIGREMAKLHQISVPDDLPHQHAYESQCFSAIMDQKINTDYKAWLVKQQLYFKENLSPQLRHCLIHGDLFYDNVLFENNRLKALIDFEEACYYYQGFDLGMSILGLCTQNEVINLDKARAFVAGYQQIQPLAAIEKQTLQIFIQYAAVTTSSWRFWKYYIDTPSVENSNKHHQMMQIAEAINQIPPLQFLTTVFNYEGLKN